MDRDTMEVQAAVSLKAALKTALKTTLKQLDVTSPEKRLLFRAGHLLWPFTPPLTQNAAFS